MTRPTLTITLSLLALSATGALAQQSQSGADIAAETREVLGASGGTGQGGDDAAQPDGTTAQPETLQMLEDRGAQPVESQQGATDGAGQDGATDGAGQETTGTADQGATGTGDQGTDGDTTAGTDGGTATSDAGQTAPGAAPTPEAIESVGYEGGALPDGQSALTVKVQILLDRAAISPGIIDGWKGGMSESAIAAFEAREGFEPDGQLDRQVWDALTAQEPAPLLQSYTITQEDASGLSAPLPDDYARLAELDRLGYTSVAEKLAERFHMDQGFLETLNADVAWQAGDTITVVDPGPRLEVPVTRVEVRKSTSRLAGFDETGRMILNYPVTIGSAQTPSPSGTVEVVAVAMDPTYTYNPDVNFQQGDNDEMLILPPGPNGPVGTVWIDLSKPTYGLHGTSDPDSLFNAASHGCVRMTNWDAEELAHLVSQGVTVEFVE